MKKTLYDCTLTILGDSYSKYEDKISLMSEKGYRVLAFAAVEKEPQGEPIKGNSKMLAAIFLTNPIRKSAPATFRYFAENGVDVKVISGDNPTTVSNIAQEAGIAGADKYIDARKLKTQEESRSSSFLMNLRMHIISAQY